jgi:succinoglycan biosynthesis protein ExoM
MSDLQRSFAIAVPTYRRPEGLRRLLDSFHALDWPASWRFDGVLVVDNDPERSARPVVEDLTGTTSWPIRYVAEPRPGVVAARNRALAETAASSHVAMIDDDEVIGDGWPRGLLELAETTDADVVGGEVRPQPDRPVPDWMLRPYYLGRVTHAHGVRVERASSGNLLIRRALLDERGPLFDERFGRSGGEDSFLTASLAADGGQIRWCASAPTFECFPVERCSLDWLAQRWRRNGATMTMVRLALARNTRERVLLRARSLVIGGARLVYGVLAPLRPGGRRPPARAEALRQRKQGIGQVVASVGRSPVAYGPGGFESPS